MALHDLEELRQLVEVLVAKRGLYLENFQLKTTTPLVLEIVVDLPEDEIGSVDLDTVSELSREINEAIDANPQIIGTELSELNVSTPGVFRELKELRHFKRQRTRLLNVQLKDSRNFLGRLLAVDGEKLEFEVLPPAHIPKKKQKNTVKTAENNLAKIKPGQFEVEFSDIAKAEVQLEFK